MLIEITLSDDDAAELKQAVDECNQLADTKPITPRLFAAECVQSVLATRRLLRMKFEPEPCSGCGCADSDEDFVETWEKESR